MLVMDLVDGVTLSERLLQAGEPIPAAEYEPWLIELTKTLEYLHQQEPPVAHGDVLIDHVVLQPDGSTAFTNYSSYSRQPIDDIKGLGMIIGYLISHRLPTISADQMIDQLSGRSDSISRTALAMLNGEVEKIDDMLRLQLAGQEKADANEPEQISSKDLPNEDDAPSTVPLASRLGDDQEENGPVSSQPVMPWDKEEENGPSTIEWGERASDSIEAAGLEPSALDTASENLPKTEPFEDRLPATEVLDSSAAQSGILKVVKAQTEPPPTGGQPLSADQIKGEEKERFDPVYESRFDGGADEEGGSDGFNWLWIIVAIMAGVILLCLACLAIGIYYAEDEEPTPAQLLNLNDANDDQTEPVATRSEDFNEGLTENEPEPTSTIAPQAENVNAPIDDLGGGEFHQNDEFGYRFELPARFEILDESDGSITIEAISGSDDKGIFLAVFPLSADSAPDVLMEQLIGSAEAEGGTIYGDPTSVTFNDLSGLSVTMNVPSGDEAIGPLLGQMITLENAEASALIVATSVPDQFEELTSQLNRMLDSLEIFEPRSAG